MNWKRNLKESYEKEPLVILTGPTAVGKTELSLLFARRTGAEILSADSMQVYRYMDIGSAKLPLEERQGVRHHLMDVLDPREDFHAAAFAGLARQTITQICSRGHLPLMTGGTGFYIQAVLYDVDFGETSQDAATRRRLEALEAEKGAAYMHRLLAQVDPEAARQIHENNRRRVIRALEFYELTGRKISEHNQTQRQKEAAYRACYFVLTDEREALYARIDKRVEEMMEAGLLQEVERLRALGCRRGMTSMQGLGYKELLDYLEGDCDLEEAVERIKRDTRHFAKRQLTWFRRERDVIWLNRSDFSSLQACCDWMLEQCKKRGILSAT